MTIHEAGQVGLRRARRGAVAVEVVSGPDPDEPTGRGATPRYTSCTLQTA